MHNNVELFKLSSSNWQNKTDYPYSMDINFYSILAVKNKFIIFGGQVKSMKVLKKKKTQKNHGND